MKSSTRILDDTLLEHSSSDFHEAGDVGTFDIVDMTVWLSTVFDACFVDALHDEVELVVYFLSRPADVRSVLGHFET